MADVMNDPLREGGTGGAGFGPVVGELPCNVVGHVELAAGTAVAVASLSAKVVSRARLTSWAASSQPRCSSIRTPDSSTAPGLAMFLPGYLGAGPCVASNVAARSPMFAPAARPMPPVMAAAASER